MSVTFNNSPIQGYVLQVSHDVYFETFEVHTKTTYHPAKATKSKHQKLWAQCMLGASLSLERDRDRDRASRLITKVSTHE